MTAPPLTWAAADDDLPRDPMARASLARRLAPWFGDLPGSSSPIRGGRQEAERRLAAIDPEAYGRNRNHLNGSVTGLSPYIRHGVLSLAEVREAVLSRLAVGDGAAALTPDEGPRAQPSDPPSATRTRRGGEGSPEPGRWHRPQGRPGGALIQQLAWRDYWQRAWLAWGEGVHLDREPLKTGLPSTAYAQGLPDDLAHGATGLACVDAFVADLLNRGWLHNHARLWLARYTVHWRRRRWQAEIGRAHV